MRGTTGSTLRTMATAAALIICAAITAFPALEALGATAPAIANQDSRNLAITNDFLRIVFVPTTASPPTMFGLPPRKRMFFQAANFLVPPLTVRQDITFPGLADNSAQTLYAIDASRQQGRESIRFWSVGRISSIVIARLRRRRFLLSGRSRRERRKQSLLLVGGFNRPAPAVRGSSAGQHAEAGPCIVQNYGHRTSAATARSAAEDRGHFPPCIMAPFHPSPASVTRCRAAATAIC